MNRYVLDTNPIVSATMLPNSVSRNAYDKAMKDGVILYSHETLSELTQVFLLSKFDKYLSIESRSRAITAFEKRGFLVDISGKLNACRDPADNKFLELAICGGSSTIITGDKDLLVLDPFNGIRIISSAEFMSKL